MISTLRESRARRRIMGPWALVAALALVLAACGDAEEAPEPEPEPEAAEEPVEAPEPAEEAEEEDLGEVFADGDSVTIIVPTAAGGGFDTEARLLQPHLEEALQEITGTNVTVRVENHPGGENRVGAQMVYLSEPDDNFVWYYFTNILTAAEARDGDDAPYRSAEFVPLAMWGGGPSAFVIRTDLDLPERSLEGLAERSQEQPILLGDVGLTVETEIMAGLMADQGNPLDFDYVSTDGTSDAVAMLLRGDVEAVYTTGGGVRPFVEDNPDDIEFLVSTSCEPDPTTPDVPTLSEAGVDGAEEICVSQTVPRVFLGAPAMSDAKAELLTTALLQVMESPEFQQEADDAGRFVQPDGPEAAREAVVSKLELLERFNDLLVEAGLL